MQAVYAVNWVNIVLALQMLSALVMIGLVLIQHGKGADMGASFGSGSSGSLFGATGSANFLSRTTAIAAAIFFSCTLILVYASDASRVRPVSGGDSVLERAAAPASAPVQIPGALPVPASAPAVPAQVQASAPAAAASAASGTK